MKKQWNGEIALAHGPAGSYLICRCTGPQTDWDERDEANTVLVQTDWDFPGLAHAFGWTLSKANGGDCQCRGTDGTIICPECGTGVGSYIASAIEYLDECIEMMRTAPDPGYFEQGE